MRNVNLGFRTALLCGGFIVLGVPAVTSVASEFHRQTRNLCAFAVN